MDTRKVKHQYLLSKCTPIIKLSIGTEVKEISSRQFRWLTEGLSID